MGDCLAHAEAWHRGDLAARYRPVDRARVDWRPRPRREGGRVRRLDPFAGKLQPGGREPADRCLRGRYVARRVSLRFGRYADRGAEEGARPDRTRAAVPARDHFLLGAWAVY